MKLTAGQWRDLNWLAKSEFPLWSSIPPERADTDLRSYHEAGYVAWTNHGWIITKAGHAALAEADALRKAETPNKGETDDNA